jgi:hypothetical protein
MQERTALENPLIALQTKRYEDEEAPGAWAVERIFIDDEDANAFLEPQRYRYPAETERLDWRLYAIPAAGQLARIVKVARWAAEKEKEEPYGEG